MKTLKKLINIFFVIFFAFPFGMVYAGGNNIMHIAAPDTHSRGRYGICYDTGSGKWQEDSAVTIRGGDYADIMPVVFLQAGTILK